MVAIPVSLRHRHHCCRCCCRYNAAPRPAPVPLEPQRVRPPRAATSLVGVQSPRHPHRSALRHLMATSLSGQRQCRQCRSAFGRLVGMSPVGERLPRRHRSALPHLMVATNFSPCLLSAPIIHLHPSCALHYPHQTRPSLFCQLPHQTPVTPPLSLVIVDC
jgi:hypothetical protein